MNIGRPIGIETEIPWMVMEGKMLYWGEESSNKIFEGGILIRCCFEYKYIYRARQIKYSRTGKILSGTSTEIIVGNILNGAKR